MESDLWSLGVLEQRVQRAQDVARVQPGSDLETEALVFFVGPIASARVGAIQLLTPVTHRGGENYLSAIVSPRKKSRDSTLTPLIASPTAMTRSATGSGPTKMPVTTLGNSAMKATSPRLLITGRWGDLRSSDDRANGPQPSRAEQAGTRA